MKRNTVSSWKELRDRRKGVLHKKEGLESSRWIFLMIIISANGTGSRMNKLKPFPIKAEDLKAPMFCMSSSNEDI